VAPYTQMARAAVSPSMSSKPRRIMRVHALKGHLPRSLSRIYPSPPDFRAK